MRDTRRKQYRPIPPTAPQHFLCPLSMEILTDPLMDHDGHNFERAAIEHWLDKGNAVCPISCKPLYRADLTPNHVLRETIVLWVEKHRNGRDSDSDSNSAIDNDGSGQGNDSQSQITIEVDSLAQHEHNSSIDESSSSNSKTNNHHNVDTNSIITSSIRESEMMEMGSIFSNKHHTASCPDVQNMMFLPQERQAIRMMRQRALERRDAERKERFAKASKAMSLVAIFILLILFVTKYARDNFLST